MKRQPGKEGREQVMRSASSRKIKNLGITLRKRERGKDAQFGLLLWKSMWENAREPENENKIIKDGESVLSLRDQNCGILAWKKRK